MSNDSKETVSELLSTGADINAKFKDGNTPLHRAVFDGYAGIVKLLLERGVKTDCYNRVGLYPLHLACERGHTRIVEILLDSGVSVDAQTLNLRSPLYLAATEGHDDVVKLLLTRGAHTNQADLKSYTPLHFAVEKCNRATIDTLLKSGAWVNARTREGDTPLLRAVFSSREEIVTLLLERGAQVDCRTHFGETPLFATLNDSRIIEILLRFGACVNSRDNDGKTALHSAAEHGVASAVAILLDNGADESMQCKRSYTPFYYAWGLGRVLESRGEYYRNRVMNWSVQRHDTIDSFFRHQVKMEAAGLNPTASSDEGLEDFYLECQLEVARMKSFIIASTNVSYFDIVEKCIRIVAKYVKNKSIVLALESEYYKREFPIYAGIIGFKFREGLARKKLVERATHVFHRIRDWPEDCTENVLDFLDDDNLKVFLEVLDDIDIQPESKQG